MESLRPLIKFCPPTQSGYAEMPLLTWNSVQCGRVMFLFHLLFDFRLDKCPDDVRFVHLQPPLLSPNPCCVWLLSWWFVCYSNGSLMNGFWLILETNKNGCMILKIACYNSLSSWNLIRHFSFFAGIHVHSSSHHLWAMRLMLILFAQFETTFKRKTSESTSYFSSHFTLFFGCGIVTATMVNVCIS